MIALITSSMQQHLIYLIDSRWTKDTNQKKAIIRFKNKYSSKKSTRDNLTDDDFKTSNRHRRSADNDEMLSSSSNSYPSFALPSHSIHSIPSIYSDHSEDGHHDYFSEFSDRRLPSSKTTNSHDFFSLDSIEANFNAQRARHVNVGFRPDIPLRRPPLRRRKPFLGKNKYRQELTPEYAIAQFPENDHDRKFKTESEAPYAIFHRASTPNRHHEPLHSYDYGKEEQPRRHSTSFSTSSLVNPFSHFIFEHNNQRGTQVGGTDSFGPKPAPQAIRPVKVADEGYNIKEEELVRSPENQEYTYKGYPQFTNPIDSHGRRDPEYYLYERPQQKIIDEPRPSTSSGYQRHSSPRFPSNNAFENYHDGRISGKPYPSSETHERPHSSVHQDYENNDYVIPAFEHSVNSNIDSRPLQVDKYHEEVDHPLEEYEEQYDYQEKFSDTYPGVEYHPQSYVRGEIEQHEERDPRKPESKPKITQQYFYSSERHQNLKKSSPKQSYSIKGGGSNEGLGNIQHSVKTPAVYHKTEDSSEYIEDNKKTHEEFEPATRRPSKTRQNTTGGSKPEMPKVRFPSRNYKPKFTTTTSKPKTTTASLSTMKPFKFPRFQAASSNRKRNSPSKNIGGSKPIHIPGTARHPELSKLSTSSSKTSSSNERQTSKDRPSPSSSSRYHI